MVKDVSLVFSRVQPSIIDVCHVALVLNSERKPDQSVDDRPAKAKDEEMLELDRDQRKRKLDLGGESHFMFFNQCDTSNVHLEEKVEALKEHPVEAGEVEEVGEGEGCAENLLGDPGGRQVVPGEGENPIEGGQAKGGEQTHVDLVPQTSHLPGMENMLDCLN